MKAIERFIYALGVDLSVLSRGGRALKKAVAGCGFWELESLDLPSSISPTDSN